MFPLMKHFAQYLVKILKYGWEFQYLPTNVLKTVKAHCKIRKIVRHMSQKRTSITSS